MTPPPRRSIVARRARARLARAAPRARRAGARRARAARAHARAELGARRAGRGREPQHQRLLIAVDDVHRADGASLGVLGQAVAVAPTNTGCCSSRPATTARWRTRRRRSSSWCRTADRIELAPLGADHTRELLDSLFGAVPGLDEAASWLHELSQGSPQSVHAVRAVPRRPRHRALRGRAVEAARATCASRRCPRRSTPCSRRASRD